MFWGLVLFRVLGFSFLRGLGFRALGGLGFWAEVFLGVLGFRVWDGLGVFGFGLGFGVWGVQNLATAQQGYPGFWVLQER